MKYQIHSAILHHPSTSIAEAAISRFMFAAGRFAVTAALLWCALRLVDVTKCWSILRHVSPVPVAGSLIIAAAATSVGAARWRLVLALEGLSVPLATLLKISWIGLFFNQMLPSGIGGDAVRVWRCQLLGLRLGGVVRSILLDRAAGYAACVVLYGIGLPALLHLTVSSALHQSLVLLFTLSAVALAALPVLDGLPQSLLRFPGLRQAAVLAQSARRLCRDGRRFMTVVFLSAVNMVLTVVFFWLLGLSVGSAASFGAWVLIVPPILVTQLVPISIAGWGVREVALVSVSAFVLPAETALAASVLSGLVNIVLALPGAIFWIARSDQIVAGPQTDEPTPAAGTDIGLPLN